MFNNMQDELSHLINTQNEPEILVNENDFLAVENGLIRGVFKDNADQEKVWDSNIPFATLK